jgi:hypothetical protein
MEKAYDLKVLADRLKDAGLDATEETAAKAITVLSDWTVESAKLSATPFDDVAAIVVPKVKDLALDLVDKINNKNNLPG